MKRLLRLAFTLLAVMMFVSIHAQTTTIKYTATEKIPRFEEIQYFVGATAVQSHTFDEGTGEGTVVYEGTVTELGSNALMFQSALTSIVIPEGVTTIGFQAFQYCSNMTTIKLPKSLKEIRAQAFGGCSGLKNGQFIIDDIAWWCSLSIGSNPLEQAKKFYSAPDVEVTNLVIPEGVTSICDRAFSYCEHITSVTLPSTLTYLGRSAFYKCTALESVDIPVSVTEIEEYAFAYCDKLTSVTIPEGVTKVGFCAFSNSGLTSLTLPSTITSMSQSFYGCADLATLTLTPGITTLGQSFYSCPSLTTVNIPGSVKEVGSSDFSRCTGLTTVVLNEGTEKVYFNSCTNLATINFPSTVREVTITNNTALTSVTLNDGIEQIYSFNDCSALTAINIPASVTYVGTFKNCNALEKVIIADVASWCNARHYDAQYYGPTLKAGKLYLGTVDDYEEITDLVIPEGVTKIKAFSFLGLPNITSVTLPSTLTSWEWKVFDGCTGITDVWCLANPITLDWSESSINFKDEKATQMHVIDKDLWMSKFPDANATFVDDLTQIDYTATAKVDAFDDIANFTGAASVLLHKFNEETGEGSVVYHGVVTAIVEEALAGSTALTGIVVPDGVAAIGARVFVGCTNLAAITLPTTITSFDNRAFEGIDSVADVWCPADPDALIWGDSENPQAFMPAKGTKMHVLVADDWTTKYPDANVTFVGGMTRFCYTATGKDNTSFYALDNFTGATEMATHDFNPETGEGTAIFKGEVTTLKYRTFYRNNLLTSIIIPTTVTSLGSDAFAECSNLTTVSLPNTITTLGSWLFYKCSALTTVNIPTSPSLTRLPEYTFLQCTSLSDITIPDNITTIGYSAFNKCTSLTSIYIPATVTTIESNGFGDCIALEKVITPSIAAWCGISFPGYNATSNPLTYAHHLFVGDKENNTEVTDLVVPDGIEEIKPLAFYGFTAMTSLTLPTTVKKLGDYAFYACTGLTEVTLPKGVEDIGKGVFDGCAALTTLTLPSTLTRIDYYAFMDVPQLVNVYCYADPATLNWQNNANQFLPEKATQFHVTDADAWTAQFPNANVTFVGDLPTGITHPATPPNLPQGEGRGEVPIYDLQGRRIVHSSESIVQSPNAPANSQLSILNSQLKPGIYIVNGKKVIKK